MATTGRRKFLGAGAAAAGVGALASAPAKAQDRPTKKVIYLNGKKPEKPGLFNQIVTSGNLVFVAGIGAHFDGDIKAHTKHVLDEIQKRLEAAGSSMDKVLKCNVYLAKAEDYAPMNEEFKGRFGAEPPVRTTIAAAWVPGNSLVEIDVIATT